MQSAEQHAHELGIAAKFASLFRRVRGDQGRRASSSISGSGFWSSRLLILSIELALVVLAAWFAARLFWAFGPPSPEPHLFVSHMSNGIQSRHLNADPSVFARFDAFYVERTSVTGVVSASAPTTTLDLKLKGLRLASDTSRGSAIIQLSGNNEQLFSVGDEVISGVRLAEILEDRVIISRAGGPEALLLNPERGSLIASAAGGQPKPIPNSVPIGESLPEPSGTTAEGLLSGLELQPRRIGRGFDGFIVQSIADGIATTALRDAGLRAGDVITSVNDIRLINFERLEEVQENIARTRIARLEIDRDGSRLSVNLTLLGGS